MSNKKRTLGGSFTSPAIERYWAKPSSAHASSDEAFVLAVLDALRKVRLEAIVVGSVAGILQGSPVTTQDLDLLVRDTPTNRRKIQALGAALGGRPRAITELSSALRIDLPAATIDVLFDQLSGNLTFQALRARSLSVSLGGQTALVARLEDVIASKEAAGRPKDLAQLPTLRDTLRVKKTLGRT